MGIFAIAFLVVMGVFGSISRTNAQSRQYTLALQLVRSVLEREIHKPYASVLPVATQIVPITFESSGNVLTLDFNVEFLVRNPEIVPGKCKHVTARVTWEDGGTPREVALDTYVSTP